MSQQTNIQWCDSSWNLWLGCTMVPAADGLKDSGCLHCYAKALDTRQLYAQGSHWGDTNPRHKFAGAAQAALALNRRPWICDHCGFSAAERGQEHNLKNGERCWHNPESWHKRRVFANSISDWLDAQVPIAWLAELLDTIRRCDQIIWILCTKRPENFEQRIAEAITFLWKNQTNNGENRGLCAWLESWLNGNFPSKGVILLASIENQAMANKRIPELLKIPAACHGLSLEPLLGEINLRPEYLRADAIRWLIIGGESGPNARPCNIEWIRSLIQQGQAANVPIFVKQLGSKPVCNCSVAVESYSSNCTQHFPVAIHHKKGGNPAEWPSDLQIQQWPQGF